MSDEVRITVEFGAVGQPAMIRCSLSETIVSEHTGDPEQTLLDGSRRILQLSERATTEVLAQLEGVRKAIQRPGGDGDA